MSSSEAKQNAARRKAHQRDVGFFRVYKFEDDSHRSPPTLHWGKEFMTQKQAQEELLAEHPGCT